MSSLRDALVVITTIATILGFYFKIFNNFFMKIIKREYENVPGNQSMFDMTLKYLAYTGIFAYITVMFVLGSKSINGNSNFNNVKSLHWIIWIVGILVFVIIFYIVFLIINIIRTTFYNFDKLKKLFFERMNGIISIPSNEMKMEGKINSLLLGAIVVIFGVQIISEIINYFELLKSNKATDKSIMVIITLIFVELFISAILIVSVNLQRVIEEFIGNYTYMILTEAEEIKCKCYIEFNEYYLILENGIERYINKSKVKEIKKIIKVRTEEIKIRINLKQFFKTIRFNVAFNKNKIDI